jgi:2-polyprenyl-6-methoxyphenol hydroxylase-like FAD-dependent oxidoreductase
MGQREKAHGKAHWHHRCGIAGLHLGLYLRQHDIDVTIVSDRTAEQITKSRLPNTAAHFAVTIDREKMLGVDHWSNPEFQYTCHNHSFGGGPQRLEFRGDFMRPSRAIDHRLYLQRLMNDFEARGGTIEVKAIDAPDLAALAQRFDLVVVASGRGSLASVFERLANRSPYDRPQRLLLAALFTGVGRTNPVGATLSVSPGHGELIDIPILTFGGMASALLFENIPCGDLEELARLRYDDNPKGFIENVLTKLEQHHPHIYNRIDVGSFDLCAPNDILQGGVTPVLRRSTLDLGGGKFAVSTGDVHCTADPLLGQGANSASHSAFVLAEEIAKDIALDTRFCERVEWRRQGRVLGASRWTNMMLQPPSPDMLDLTFEMSRNPLLCNEFTNNFNFPERQWDRLASAQRIRAWIDDRRDNVPAAAVV